MINKHDLEQVKLASSNLVLEGLGKELLNGKEVRKKYLEV